MRPVIALSVVLFVLLAAPLRSASDAPDPGATGPYEIGHTSFFLVDPTRSGRSLPVNVWYPAETATVESNRPPAIYALDPIYQSHWPVSTSADWEQFGMDPAYEGIAPSADKPFPLVLVSPGWGVRYYGMLFYAQRLASHGFVVAVAQHIRDGAYAWEPRDPVEVAALNRPRDVSLMLDAILERNADPANLLFNSVRPDLVAASGHSLGGYAAMALAAGDDVVCASGDPLVIGCESLGSTPSDLRIKAIVPLDGSNQLLHFSELARISVPSMAIGQAWENVQSWQARQHAAIAGEPNYRADIQGAVHASFINNCTVARVFYSKGLSSAAQLNNALNTPQCSTALDQREVNRLAAMYAVAFLRTHLAGDTRYQATLTPGWALAVGRHVEFFVTEPVNATSLGEDPLTFRYFLHQPGSATERAGKDPANPPAVVPIEG